MNYFRKIEAACLQPALHDAIPRALALKGIAFLWIWLEGRERRKILQKRCSRCFSVSNRDSFLPCFPEAPPCHGWEAEILHPTRLRCWYSRWQLAAQLHVTSQRRTEPTVANVCSSVCAWLAAAIVRPPAPCAPTRAAALPQRLLASAEARAGAEGVKWHLQGWTARSGVSEAAVQPGGDRFSRSRRARLNFNRFLPLAPAPPPQAMRLPRQRQTPALPSRLPRGALRACAFPSLRWVARRGAPPTSPIRERGVVPRPLPP